MMIETLYLIAIFAIGLLVSVEDSRKGVIKNSRLTLLMVFFTVYFAVNFGAFAPQASAFLTNLVLSVALGVALWLFGLWPSGDAKLFIVLCVMLPPSLLVSSTSPLSDIMINAFVPLFFFYFFSTTLRSGRKRVRESLKKAFEPYRVILIGISYLGMAWLINLPLKALGISTPVAFILILFVVVEIFYRVKRLNLEYLFVAAAILRLVFDYKTVYDLGFILPMMLTVLVFIVFRFFFLDLAFSGNTRAVKLAELKPGMKLAEGITEKDGKYEKNRILLLTLYDLLHGGTTERFIHSISDEGLTEEEIKKIQGLAHSKKLGFDDILVHLSVPFALFLFVGFFLTVLMNGSFVPFLRTLLFG